MTKVIFAIIFEMSQETRPHVYPLLPQNEGTMLNAGTEATKGGSQVIALQTVTTNESNPTAGTNILESKK